jgi:hypothetical protein
MIYPMISHFLYNIVPGHNIHNFPCCLDPLARSCQLAGVGSLPCGFKPKWCLGQRQNLLQIWRNDGKNHGKWWLNWLNWLNSMDWFSWENLNTGNHQFPMKIMVFSISVAICQLINSDVFFLVPGLSSASTSVHREWPPFPLHAICGNTMRDNKNKPSNPIFFNWHNENRM